MRVTSILFMSALVYLASILAVTQSPVVDQIILSTPSSPGIEQPSSSSPEEANNSNFIFASFASLLQQWPNSFAYSGHSIIPGIIPTSTVLYHGTNNGDPPPARGFEWLAFDPEMSYSIHSRWNDRNDLCRYMSTRPLRIIYLDGQSASLGTAGFMDSQSVIINGTVNLEFEDRGHFLEAEYLRAGHLCAIGKNWGFEGVVRMNSGFELIWCDFTQGIKLLGCTNTTHPPEGSQVVSSTVPSTEISTPVHSRIALNARWSFGRAASRHFFSPGEVRAKLDPSGFISFYDRIPSLDAKRRLDGSDKGSRFDHRLYGISSSDATQIQDRLFNVIARKNAQDWKLDDPDRLDWRDVVLSIIQTYDQPLTELAFVLRRDDISMIEQVLQVRDSTYGMLMPYIDFSNWNITDSTWVNRGIEHCTKAFTSAHDYADSELTDSIQLIINAIEGTLARLCTTVHQIFAQSFHMVSSSTVDLDGRVDLDKSSSRMVKSKLLEWTKLSDDLINWLGWSTWGHCDPICKSNEICMPPMWPVVMGSQISTYQPVCLNITTWDKLRHF